MTLKIPSEVELAVHQNNGMTQAGGEQQNYVVMSVQCYRDTFGIGTDAEFEDSVAKIKQSIDQMEQGKTRPLRDVLDDIGRKHETA
jgi:hypothetical protein